MHAHVRLWYTPNHGCIVNRPSCWTLVTRLSMPHRSRLQSGTRSRTSRYVIHVPLESRVIYIKKEYVHARTRTRLRAQYCLEYNISSMCSEINGSSSMPQQRVRTCGTVCSSAWSQISRQDDSGGTHVRTCKKRHHVYVPIQHMTYVHVLTCRETKQLLKEREGQWYALSQFSSYSCFILFYHRDYTGPARVFLFF
jgi:hypothetical protein